MMTLLTPVVILLMTRELNLVGVLSVTCGLQRVMYDLQQVTLTPILHFRMTQTAVPLRLEKV